MPEPISRILYGVAAADGHSSRPSITERLKRPTRRFGAPSRHALKTACAVSNSLPIWSCSVWGLPCVAHYCSTGALLPHLFTLTATVEHLRLRGLAPALPSRPAQKRIGFRRSLMCGGIFSVALSVKWPSRHPTTRNARRGPRETTLPDVIRHTALRSSDFPLSGSRSPGIPGVHNPDSDHPVRHQLPIL